eukprot:CAMPEP_0194298112 /NCGR_PEP_ID=MMETSP0169-20130528/59983_1 /TAXON_ID=218684 /ORGANISM="Corethron pennatum, Strain L29A3" /LENGTH=667 /DNA_ID=CAMNT_0039048059 /DNA_START=643 /DNA_END=2646 /DNA_ORIENTATION=+
MASTSGNIEYMEEFELQPRPMSQKVTSVLSQVLSDSSLNRNSVRKSSRKKLRRAIRRRLGLKKNKKELGASESGGCSTPDTVTSTSSPFSSASSVSSCSVDDGCGDNMSSTVEVENLSEKTRLLVIARPQRSRSTPTTRPISEHPPVRLSRTSSANVGQHVSLDSTLRMSRQGSSLHPIMYQENPDYILQQVERMLSDSVKESYNPYYDDTDLMLANWSSASYLETNVPLVGLGMVAAATVFFHPVLFFAGTAGAAWTVGMYHTMEHGYDYINDGTFSRLFWTEHPDDTEERVFASEEEKDQYFQTRYAEAKKQASEMERYIDPLYGGIFGVDLHTFTFEEAPESAEDILNDTLGEVVGCAAFTDCCGDMEMVQHTPLVALDEKLIEKSVTDDSSVEAVQSSVSLGMGKSVVEVDVESPQDLCDDECLQNVLPETLNRHFPPMTSTVVKGAKLPMIQGVEIFDIFLSDDAPFSFKQFQRDRGDVEIKYTEWKVPDIPTKFTLGQDPKPALKTVSSERTCSYKTLTKSYFGPTYAGVKSTQRYTLVNDHLCYFEVKTFMCEIPLCDRFYIVERWKFDSSPEETQRPTSLRPEGMYTRVTIECELRMTKSCSWEKQIRGRCIQTVSDICNSWCKRATRALKLADKKKSERLKRKTMRKGVSAVLDTICG